MVIPFDTRAALVSAEIRRDKAFVNALKEQQSTSRICIKSDIIIAGTAKAHGVQRLYTDDQSLRACADRCKLSAMPIPLMSEMKLRKKPRVSPVLQRSLFDSPSLDRHSQRKWSQYLRIRSGSGETPQTSLSPSYPRLISGGIRGQWK